MSQIDIEQYVQRKVKDGAFYGDILPAMSRAVRFIAASEKPLILLQPLLASGTVTAGSASDSVAMPDDYFRELYKCTRSTPAIEIDIYPSKQVMESALGIAAAGYVQGVCVEAGYLHYNNKPASDDVLTLYYYAAPDDFTDGEDDAVSWLPAEFHNPLIGNYAAAEILADMADDPDYGAERRALAAERAARLMNDFNASMADLYAKTHKLRPKQRAEKVRHTRFF